MVWSTCGSRVMVVVFPRVLLILWFFHWLVAVERVWAMGVFGRILLPFLSPGFRRWVLLGGGLWFVRPWFSSNMRSAVMFPFLSVVRRTWRVPGLETFMRSFESLTFGFQVPSWLRMAPSL